MSRQSPPTTLHSYLACPIVYRQPVAPGHWRFTLECPEIAQEAQPGQFVQVRVPAADRSSGLRPDARPAPRSDPLLPRPMSIYGVEDGRVELLIQAVGEGTRSICEQQVGGELGLLGPLGHGFAVHDGPGRVALIGGGVGVAPLVFAAQQKPAEGEWMAFVGARTSEWLVGVADLTARVPVRVATDDGSEGFAGTVVDLFRHEAAGQSFDLALVCGPAAMMRAAAEACRHLGIRCQVSVETLMACGFGVCLGCAVPTPSGGYLRACIEGPCLAAEDVVLL